MATIEHPEAAAFEEAAIRGTDLRVWLIAAYVVTLLSLPPDIGVSVAGVVLSASRLVLLVAIVAALLQARQTRSTVATVPGVVWVGWLLFLGSALVTTLLFASADSFARYVSLVVEGLVVFTLVYAAGATQGGVRTLSAVFVATLVAVAAATLLLALGGLRYEQVLADLTGSLPARVVDPRFGFERFSGPFRAPLYFAIWMTAGSALLLPAMAAGARATRALALGAWAVLFAAVISLTLSRIAITAMLVLPGVYFVVRRPRWIGTVFLAAACVVALGMGFLTVDPSSGISESGAMRLSAFEATLVALRTHPVFGWGLLSDVTVLSEIIGTRNWVDNTYLSYLVTLGVAGCAGFIVLMAAILATSRRGWRTPNGLALAISVVAILGMGLLASIFQSSQGYAAFFVLAALLSAAARPLREPRDLQILGPQAPASPSDSVAHVPDQGISREVQPGA